MKTKFEIKRNCGYENSFGAVGERDTVTLKVTVAVTDERKRGHFEFYDIETRGDRFYAEGGLWFKPNSEGILELVDYDGVFSLSDFILDALDDNGYDVADMKRVMAS